MPIRKTVFAIFSILVISGCGYIQPKDFPPPNLQPSIEPSNEIFNNTAMAHGLWLESKTPFSEEGQHSKARETLRLRGSSKDGEHDVSTTIPINIALSDYYRKFESKVYRSKKDHPVMCLALSGGGIRSAAFSIGVLQGLQEKGILSSIDVISAVSGGSYALAWYSQNRANGLDEANIFDDEYIEKTINPSLFSLPVATLGVVLSPVNFGISGSYFANGIDSSTLKNSYLGMLSGSFGASVLNLNGMEKIKQAASDGTLPLPIIGMSAFPLPGRLFEFGKPDQALSSHARSVALNDTYLEATPYRYGLNGFGFHEKPPTPIANNIWSYVALSGAGYDYPHDAKSLGRLSKGLIRLGGTLSFMTTRNYPSAVDKTSTEQLYRQYFYVSDGGFVENLAMYPLIMRRCETIIVADAEYDPEWIFEGYRVLKTRLASEHDLTLTIPEIDKRISQPLPEQIEYKWRSDGIQLPFTDAECARESGETPCAARTAKDTIFTGTVPMIPLTVSDLLLGPKTRIIYLKLGTKVDPQKSLSARVEVHYKECMQTPKQCHFPQDPTVNRNEPTKSQQYTEAQFMAYKDLAKRMIQSINWEM